MFVRKNGPIFPELHLIKIGHSCVYLLGDSEECVLFDCGSSAHIPALLKRIEQLELSTDTVKQIFLTSLNPERIAGLAAFKKELPQLKVIGSEPQRALLSDNEFLKKLHAEDQAISKLVDTEAEQLSLNEFSELTKIDTPLMISDKFTVAEELHISPFETRGLSTPSVAYYVTPLNALIGNEVLGYFQGSKLATPGADMSLDQGEESLAELSDLEISSLCLTSGGVLTGNLVNSHLKNLIQNSRDIKSETLQAAKDGVSEEEILSQVKAAFFELEERNDPFVAHALERVEAGILLQITAED